MYGNPTFRFTLSHDVLGSQIISEPQNWQEAKLRLERHDDYHTLVEYFEGSFIFYGSDGVDDGGIDFIKSVESSYGVDAELNIVIEVSFDDGDSFETVFTGLLDLSDIQETKNNKAEIPIIRNDFWAKFINRRDTPVNLSDDEDLDGNAVNQIDPVDLNLPSQVIQKTLFSKLSTVGPRLDEVPFMEYVQGTPENVVQDEIEDTFNLIYATNSEIPVDFMDIKEAGYYTFDMRITASTSTGGSGSLRNVESFNFYLRVNTLDYLFTKTDFGVFPEAWTECTINIEVYLNPGDRVYFYGQCDQNFERSLTIWGEVGSTGLSGNPIANLTGLETPTYFNVVGQTITPPTDSEGFFIHDAAGSILDKIIGQNNTFYSELLGSTQTNYRQYLSDGCGWENILLQGLQIRGYELSAKQFAMSFNKWWNGANPILNLGLGYDTVDGVEVIRVEDKEYFFDSSPSLFIDYVYEIIREYDKNRIYKKIEIGYNKWESEDISGIDDPQTKHTYATRFEKVGTDIRLYSEFIAASLAIEVTRRQTIEKSKDYKFDNDIFIIAINGDNVSPDRYQPELMENFNFVTNLLYPETRYNLRLTPARNLLRWLKFMNNGLQSYVGSVYKFTFGEGNYDMISDMVISTPGCEGDFSGAPLSEKQNIDVTNEYVFLPQEFTIEINLSWEDYKTIRDNRRKAIAVSQTNVDHVSFFIKSLDYEVVRGKATMKLWPVLPFEISVVDFVPTIQECAADDACIDAITNSLGDELVDEFGECITA